MVLYHLFPMEHGLLAQLVGHIVKIPILIDVDVNEVLASRSHN